MAVEIVVMGCSMGGLVALETVLGSLPQGFNTPVAIVQHRMPDSKNRLVPLLQMHTGLRVKEPLDKEPVEPGTVYVAPADYHLLIDEDGFTLSTDEPVLSARPSIDVLFESAADSLGEGVIGVILTGASADGAAGAARIKENGGRLIVQDPESAESPVMPRAAISRVSPDRILPLQDIGSELGRMAAGID